MQTVPHSNPCKRQHPDQYPFQLKGACQPVLKKRKIVSRRNNEQPAAFWNNLSEIPLTKRALRELNRRNAQAAPISSTHQRTRRPATRRAAAEWKRHHSPPETATSLLADCRYNWLNDIKSFSRHGGPNLSDVRGVWIFKHFFKLVLIFPVPEVYQEY